MDTAPAKRVAVYVDGFNLYRGLAKPLDCKWVNLVAMFEAILRARRLNEQLAFLHYFSAEVVGTAVERQRRLLNAFRATPKMRVTLGVHAPRDFECEVAACDAVCERYFRGYVEKRTDVAIGVHMVRDALTNIFDLALLVSGDSDFIPAAEMVLAANKELILLIPTLSLQNEEQKLRTKADHYRAILGHANVTLVPIRPFLRSQMPDPFLAPDGSSHAKPESWRLAPVTALEDLKASIASRPR